MSEQVAGRKARGKKNHWIPVAAGFLKKDGKILIGQRPENNSLPGLWEFPGGKIELGESPEEALKRELSEELGIDADIGDLKLSCTHSFGDIGIVILFFEVPYWRGEPKPKHHLMLQWIPPEELGKHNIPEANRKILNRLLKAIQGE